MTAESYPAIITALCLWREARGQDREAKRAVLHVIQNRAAAKFRGTNPTQVVLWPYQFSSFIPGDPNASKLPDPRNVGEFRAWLECCGVVDNPGSDPTGGALMYHSCPKGSDRWPDWATEEKQTAHVGPFWFYRT